MTITAQVIEDSISPDNIRLTTLQLRYPRFIHAEVLTHRALSRNSSSSRAIPVNKLIEDVLRDTAMPIHWGKNIPGMQAKDEHRSLIWASDYNCPSHATTSLTSQEAWLQARDMAVDMARAFAEAGYHKQVVNRILEPFAHINVVVTATDWSNFFALRRHEDAQPEIKALADAIYEAMQASVPKKLRHNEWHLPYVTDDDWSVQSPDGGIWAEAESQVGDAINYHAALELAAVKTAIRVSVARCARVSYLTHDGRRTTVEEDIALYDRLVGAAPLHASPAEHQATPDSKVRDIGIPSEWENRWLNPHLHGNLRGWIQYRKTLPGECQ